MKLTNITKVFFTAVLMCAFLVSRADASCISVTANMAQGATDATTGGQVTILQKYLASAGYLKAVPNGVYGPATVAAVKAFQAANGISATGQVAALTRAALSIRSCSSTAATPEPTKPTKPTQTIPVPTTPAVSPIVTSMPTNRQSLGLGDTATVKWSGGPSNITYNVILEDGNGVAQGFLVYGSYATQYTWTVGNVINASTGNRITVAPGTYRIHAVDAAMGAQSSDKPSATFAISGNVSVSQMFPRTAPPDGATSVVLYGSGFSDKSMIYISGYGNTGPLFVSPDGRVIIFTVPNGLSVGVHFVSVLNTYGTTNGSTNATTIESNQTPLSVVNP